MAVLLLDIGNSRIKWGVQRDGSVRETGIANLRDLADEIPADVDSTIACNVAGDKIANEVAAVVETKVGTQIEYVQSTREAGGVRNSYADPSSLGVDRWVALIGARASTTEACIVVDAGTAVTIDALDADGQHLGGQILPGLQLMAKALNRDTSDLPDVSERLAHRGQDDRLFANDTVDAIAAGVVSAATGAIAQAVQALPAGGHAPALLLTGGDAGLLQRRLKGVSELRPNLVLEGLARLARREPD